MAIQSRQEYFAITGTDPVVSEVILRGETAAAKGCSPISGWDRQPQKTDRPTTDVNVQMVQTGKVNARLGKEYH